MSGCCMNVCCATPRRDAARARHPRGAAASGAGGLDPPRAGRADRFPRRRRGSTPVGHRHRLPHGGARRRPNDAPGNGGVAAGPGGDGGSVHLFPRSPHNGLGVPAGAGAVVLPEVRGKESDRRNARGEDALDQALLVAICGATATGKTAVAAALARALGGEIVAADSRTIYRGMNIGIAKPTPEQRAAVPHHLLDVPDPAEGLTLAQYHPLAVTPIPDILPPPPAGRRAPAPPPPLGPPPPARFCRPPHSPQLPLRKIANFLAGGPLPL